MTSWMQDLTGREALERHALPAALVLDRLVATISAPPRLVALLRATCAAAQELPPLPDLQGATTPAAGDAESTIVRFAEQFSIDVSAVDPALRAALWAALGETPRQARGRLLAMAWVADYVPRVRVALDRLFAPSAWPAAGAEAHVEDATPLAHEFVRVVHSLHGLDPVVSERVRLRGAHAHDCRLCRSLRSRTALEAGASADELDERDLAALPPAHAAALALVDAVIWSPARMPEDMVGAVREHWTPAQGVELVLDVMRNAWNKTTVAAQLDAAHVAQGVEVYEYRDDGTVHFGLAAPEPAVTA